MYKLLFDSIACFKSDEELENYIQENPSAYNISLSGKANSDTAFIHSCFNKHFEKLCQPYQTLRDYAKGCTCASNPDLYKPILYSPLMVDMILSSLYTAEYLKSQSAFILVPELLCMDATDLINLRTQSINCKDDTIHSATSSYPASAIHRTKILYPLSPNLYVNNEIRKKQYKRFFSATISKFWNKIFDFERNPADKNVKYAVPLFQCDLVHTLVNLPDWGIKQKTIDLDKYYSHKLLQPYQEIPELKDILLQYKIERVFHPRLINYLASNLLSCNPEYDYSYLIDDEQLSSASKIILCYLKAGVIGIGSLLPYLNFPNAESPTLSNTNVLSDYFSHQFRIGGCSDNDAVDLTFCNHLTAVLDKINDFSEGIAKLRMNFFADLFSYFNSYEKISKLCLSIIQNPQDNLCYRVFFDFHPLFAIKSSSQKRWPENLCKCKKTDICALKDPLRKSCPKNLCECKKAGICALKDSSRKNCPENLCKCKKADICALKDSSRKSYPENRITKARKTLMSNTIKHYWLD